MTFGEKLKERREELGISQTQLAAAIGVKTASIISNWEKDKATPDIRKLVALSESLDISLDDLFSISHKDASDLTDIERKYVHDLRKLDSIGVDVVLGNLKLQLQRCSKTSSITEKPQDSIQQKCVEKPFLAPKDPKYQFCREKIPELKTLKKEASIDAALLTEFLWHEGYSGLISITDIVLLFSGLRVPSEQFISDITNILNKRISYMQQ